VDSVIDDLAPARPPVASFTVVEEPAPERSLADRLFGAPGWAFHAVFGVGALSTLWATSSPSGLDVTGDPFAWFGLACVLSWVLRFAVAASRRTLTSAFVGAPLIAAVVATGVYFEVPQETRWMQAEGGFETALRALPTAQKWDQAIADETVPGRIGSYWIEGVTRDAAGAAQFHLGSGLMGVIDSTGSAFTYLVDGPTAAVKDANPGMSFEHLHGNWYVLSH
jgi:hypothetical protein